MNSYKVEKQAFLATLESNPLYSFDTLPRMRPRFIVGTNLERITILSSSIGRLKVMLRTLSEVLKAFSTHPYKEEKEEGRGGGKEIESMEDFPLYLFSPYKGPKPIISKECNKTPSSRFHPHETRIRKYGWVFHEKESFSKLQRKSMEKDTHTSTLSLLVVYRSGTQKSWGFCF